MVRKLVEPGENALYLAALETILPNGWIIKSVEALSAVEMKKWKSPIKDNLISLPGSMTDFAFT